MYLPDTQLTVPAVAEVLNCNTTYVYRAIRNKRIKSLNTTPTKVRFNEVIKYIESPYLKTGSLIIKHQHKWKCLLLKK